MTPINESTANDAALLLHAYLDGELDPINALEMERRIASDPALKSERDRIEALRQIMRERLPRETPSPALRARIEKAVGTQQATERQSWRAMAASIAVAAVVSSSATWLVISHQRVDTTENAVLAAHIRGLMAPLPTDVTSAEGHTVKPWFNGRIPQSPRVIDLAAAGFPLAGGRVDVIGYEPVPTLIYRRRQHVISLTAVKNADTSAVLSQARAHGYNVIKWTENGIAYWAVSDLNAKELEEFSNRIRTGG